MLLKSTLKQSLLTSNATGSKCEFPNLPFFSVLANSNIGVSLSHCLPSGLDQSSVSPLFHTYRLLGDQTFFLKWSNICPLFYIPAFSSFLVLSFSTCAWTRTSIFLFWWHLSTSICSTFILKMQKLSETGNTFVDPIKPIYYLFTLWFRYICLCEYVFVCTYIYIYVLVYIYISSSVYNYIYRYRMRYWYRYRQFPVVAVTNLVS